MIRATILTLVVLIGVVTVVILSASQGAKNSAIEAMPAEQTDLEESRYEAIREKTPNLQWVKDPNSQSHQSSRLTQSSQPKKQQTAPRIVKSKKVLPLLKSHAERTMVKSPRIVKAKNAEANRQAAKALLDPFGGQDGAHVRYLALMRKKEALRGDRCRGRFIDCQHDKAVQLVGVEYAIDSDLRGRLRKGNAYTKPSFYLD